MEKLPAFIQREIEPILQDWERYATTLSPQATLTRDRLRDHAREILLAAAKDMEQAQTAHQKSEKSKGRAPGNSPALTLAAQSHAISRMADQFSLNELVGEFRALRASVAARWAETGPSHDELIEELTRFHEAIDQAMAASMAHYQAKLEEARAVILGVLAHDLRNPLNAISLSTHFILRSEPLHPQSAQAAARMLNSVARMKHLVQDLLDYTTTRLGTGLPIHRQPADLAHIARGVVEEVEASHPGRKVFCVATGNPKGEWDAARLAQLLTNLLANALQHGDAEQPVKVLVEDAEGGVVLKVINQGEPIPQEERAALFQPLKPRHKPEKASAGSSGLGLGLYVVAEIAGAHGGRAELSSSDSSGTIFRVFLPRKGGPGS